MDPARALPIRATGLATNGRADAIQGTRFSRKFVITGDRCEDPSIVSPISRGIQGFAHLSP